MRKGNTPQGILKERGLVQHGKIQTFACFFTFKEVYFTGYLYWYPFHHAFHLSSKVFLFTSSGSNIEYHRAPLPGYEKKGAQGERKTGLSLNGPPTSSRSIARSQEGTARDFALYTTTSLLYNNLLKSCH